MDELKEKYFIPYFFLRRITQSIFIFIYNSNCSEENIKCTFQKVFLQFILQVWRLTPQLAFLKRYGSSHNPKLKLSKLSVLYLEREKSKVIYSIYFLSLQNLTHYQQDDETVKVLLQRECHRFCSDHFVFLQAHLSLDGLLFMLFPHRSTATHQTVSGTHFAEGEQNCTYFSLLILASVVSVRFFISSFHRFVAFC